MAGYLIHYNPYHDKLGRFDKRPFSYDYYDYSKDHIERVKKNPEKKFSSVKEIYTDKYGNTHELKLLDSHSQRRMRKKYEAERSIPSMYAHTKEEDVKIHRDLATAESIRFSIGLIANAAAMPMGWVVIPNPALPVKSFMNRQLAKKIDDGLMNMTENELKAYKAKLKEEKIAEKEAKKVAKKTSLAIET